MLFSIRLLSIHIIQISFAKWPRETSFAFGEKGRVRPFKVNNSCTIQFLISCNIRQHRFQPVLFVVASCHSYIFHISIHLKLLTTASILYRVTASRIPYHKLDDCFSLFYELPSIRGKKCTMTISRWQNPQNFLIHSTKNNNCEKLKHYCKTVIKFSCLTHSILIYVTCPISNLVFFEHLRWHKWMQRMRMEKIQKWKRKSLSKF